MTKEASLKAIDKLIGEAKGAYAKAHTNVQEAAIAIIQHAKEYNDCSRAKVLCRVVPARDRNMLVGYFLLFSPINVKMGNNAQADKVRISTDEQVVKFRKMVAQRTENEDMKEAEKFPIYHIDGAKVHQWFDDPASVSPEPAPLNTETDFWELVDKLIDREIEKAKKDGDDARYKPEERAKVIAHASEAKVLIGKFRATKFVEESKNKEEDQRQTDSGMPVERAAA